MNQPGRLNDFMKFQRTRIHRVRNMTGSEFFTKLRERACQIFSYRSIVRRLAYHLNAHSIKLYVDRYKECPEVGPQNIELKYDRVRQGGPFEPYSISVVNKAAVQLLGPEKRILEIGCGTGMFSFLAAQESHRELTASELDDDTLQWAIEHRSRSNIQYCNRPLVEFEVDEFDVVVAIEIIEHISDYPKFLNELSCVAATAILTTPNKNRSPFDSIANTPVYGEHVREWTSGEFFWVLRSFYADVIMYTIPDFASEVHRFRNNPDSMPAVKTCSVLEHSEHLIAVCRRPIRAGLQTGH